MGQCFSLSHGIEKRAADRIDAWFDLRKCRGVQDENKERGIKELVAFFQEQALHGRLTLYDVWHLFVWLHHRTPGCCECAVPDTLVRPLHLAQTESCVVIPRMLGISYSALHVWQFEALLEVAWACVPPSLQPNVNNVGSVHTTERNHPPVPPIPATPSAAMTEDQWKEAVSAALPVWLFHTLLHDRVVMVHPWPHIRRLLGLATRSSVLRSMRDPCTGNTLLHAVCLRCCWLEDFCEAFDLIGVVCPVINDDNDENNNEKEDRENWFDAINKDRGRTALHMICANLKSHGPIKETADANVKMIRLLLRAMSHKAILQRDHQGDRAYDLIVQPFLERHRVRERRLPRYYVHARHFACFAKHAGTIGANVQDSETGVSVLTRIADAWSDRSLALQYVLAQYIVGHLPHPEHPSVVCALAKLDKCWRVDGMAGLRGAILERWMAALRRCEAPGPCTLALKHCCPELLVRLAQMPALRNDEMLRLRETVRHLRRMVPITSGSVRAVFANQLCVAHILSICASSRMRAFAREHDGSIAYWLRFLQRIKPEAVASAVHTRRTKHPRPVSAPLPVIATAEVQ